MTSKSVTIKRNGGARPKVRGKAGLRRPGAGSPRSRPVSRIDKFIRALPVTPETIQKTLTWGMFGMAMAGIITAMHISGVNAAIGAETVRLVGQAGFRVERVEIIGAERVDTMRIYDIALNHKSRSMAAVDLDAVRAELLKYGWIADASVSRKLPDTLVIHIEERTPTAMWQHAGRLSLIDTKGVVLEPVDPARAPDLPLVIGPNANQHAAALHRLLDEAQALKPLLAGASWVGNRRWDLRFQSGEILALPAGEKAAATALMNFARMDGMNRLLGRGIARFDMRNPDRMVLRRSPRGESVQDAAIATGGASGSGSGTVADTGQGG